MFDDDVLYEITQYIGNKRLRVAIKLTLTSEDVAHIEMDNRHQSSRDIHFAVLKVFVMTFCSLYAILPIWFIFKHV